MVSQRHTDDEPDRFGMEGRESRLAAFVGSLLPQTMAVRALTATVATDRRRYKQGEPVEITIEFRNRLPIPVTVETPTRRRWTWTVDGLPEASEERIYLEDHPSELSFDARECKRIRRRWDGQFKRETGSGTRWERAAPDEYEIGAALSLDDGQVADSTTIRIEP